MLDSLKLYYENSTFFMYYVLTLIILIGLVIGSFLNVVGLRLLSGESIVFPPSKCPKCNTKLKWYDNIPLLSYLILWGKCRYCKTHISLQYPIVEAATALSYLLIFLKFGFSYATPMLCILASLGIIMCITDIKEQVIVDWVCYPLIPLGLIYTWFNLGGVTSEKINFFNTGFYLQEIFISALFGIILAFVFFEGICFISKHLIIKQRIFGEGDTIIAMAFAAWLGWKMLIIMLISSIVLQTLFAFPSIMLNLCKCKDKTPLISLLVSIFAVILTCLYRFLWVGQNYVLNLIFMILISIVAIISIIIFSHKIKTLNMLTPAPFGPALIVAGFIVIYYGDVLLNYFQYLNF